MRDLTKVIYGMVTENTGSNFLDSGDAYGRHHEKNSKKSLDDFLNESVVEYDRFMQMPTINVFHFLNNQPFEIDSICEYFNKLNVGCDNWDSDLYGVSREAEEFLETFGAELNEADNTYNHEHHLSQELQFMYIDINNEDYILIQLHQGCDVRGGYTDARLFKLDFVEPFMDFVPIITGTVYKTDTGETIYVDTAYDGINLTDDNGLTVDVKENDIVELDVIFE